MGLNPVGGVSLLPKTAWFEQRIFGHLRDGGNFIHRHFWNSPAPRGISKEVPTGPAPTRGTQGSFPRGTIRKRGKMGHQHGKEREWTKRDPSVPPSLWRVRPFLLPIHGCVQQHPSPPQQCHGTHSQIILQLSLPKSNQGGHSKPFSRIPQPLAGPGVQLREGYGHMGKARDSRHSQPNVEISPWRGKKRGEKNLGNPFFQPKSKPQDTLRVTLFPLPMRKTQTQIFLLLPKGIN